MKLRFFGVTDVFRIPCFSLKDAHLHLWLLYHKTGYITSMEQTVLRLSSWMMIFLNFCSDILSYKYDQYNPARIVRQKGGFYEFLQYG